MASLELRTTDIFESLFSATGSPQASARALTSHPQYPATITQEQPRPPNVQMPQVGHARGQEIVQSATLPRATTFSQTSPTIPNNREEFPIPRPIGIENFVANSDRLRPIIRNSAGQMVDKKLPFGTYDENVQRIRNMSLCSWHYLRSDHNVNNCKRSHDHPRPLSNDDYDALWLVTRIGFCNRLRNEGDCNDDQCIYGHGLVES